VVGLLGKLMPLGRDRGRLEKAERISFEWGLELPLLGTVVVLLLWLWVAVVYSGLGSPEQPSLGQD